MARLSERMILQHLRTLDLRKHAGSPKKYVRRPRGLTRFILHVGAAFASGCRGGHNKYDLKVLHGKDNVCQTLQKLHVAFVQQ